MKNSSQHIFSFRDFNRIRSAVEKTIQKDGPTQTSIPFLSMTRFSQPTLFNTGILNPCFCFIVQGKKELHIGKEVISYGAGDYLVATIDMPSTGRVADATKLNPYLGLKIDLDVKEIASIAIEAKLNNYVDRRPVSGAFVGKSDLELVEVIFKLLRILEKPKDAAFLAGAIRREIIYRLLSGEHGHLFYQNVVLDHQDLGIGKAVHWLKKNFNRPLKMEQLAKTVNMSVSSLHHKFKAVTKMGPLQYQKQLRLLEARQLMLTGSIDASTAAYQVGYESLSQFSREYRRLFGAPPKADVKTLRAKSKIELLHE